jgi:hypothetical protein
MADILLDEQSVPATPASGQLVVFGDSTASVPSFKNDAGRSGVMWGSTNNVSIANLTVNAADTYVTDSDLLIPSFGLQARTVFMWTLSASKTGAGTATPIYNIRIGSARSVAGDTARLALTGPAQTAIADIGTLYVMATVRSVGGAGVIQGTAWWVHRGTAANTTTSGTGFANDSTGHVEAASSGFDNSALAGQYIGLSVNSGTLGVWTVTQVWAAAYW